MSMPKLSESNEVPFGGEPIYYNYKCTKCKYKSKMNEANVDVAYGWTKKRVKCSEPVNNFV